MNRIRRYPAEVKERAVRLVFESEEDQGSQWAAIRSVAEKIGCSAEGLRKWVRQAEQDGGRRPSKSRRRGRPVRRGVPVGRARLIEPRLANQLQAEAGFPCQVHNSAHASDGNASFRLEFVGQIIQPPRMAAHAHSIIAHEIAHAWRGDDRLGMADPWEMENGAARLTAEWEFSGLGADPEAATAFLSGPKPDPAES